MENIKTVIFTGEFEGNKTETTVTIKVIEGDIQKGFDNVINSIVQGGFLYASK